MQAQRLNITLPYELAQNLRKTIPAKRRSKFIADAVREKLPGRNLKKEWARSLKAQEKILKEIREDFKYIDAEAFERIP